jgi:hypothetical protein
MPFQEKYEDPSVHLTRVTNICEVVGQKNLPKDGLLLKLFHWSFKDKAFKWLQTLPRNTIASSKYCIKSFMNRFNPFYKTMQVKGEILKFLPEYWREIFPSLGQILRITYKSSQP